MTGNHDTPLHMQDLNENVPLLPKTNEVEEQEGAHYVDIGSIQTEPRAKLSEYKVLGKGLSSLARVTEDGRIVISLDMKKALPDLPRDHARNVEEFAVDEKDWKDVPNMSIVIMIVGSRGDVQPYVALGKRLRTHGHRVRVASHETFRSFVVDNGLEFFDIGGNPQDLMSYMVKNPGLIPGIDSLTNGDIGKKRKMLDEMMQGCWQSCHSPDQKTGQSFTADAIISNPPAFAHVHCAEALGVPLLMSFTMPWSPTADFQHPLVNIQDSNAKPGLTNVLSYALAEIVTWQGTGDLVNVFRTKTLGLSPLAFRSGAGLVDRLKIPWTYCMSPALIPKPDDWKNHIDVVGFYFLDLASNYQPDDDLKRFLEAGDAPIYIGFGSVVVDDAAAMSKTIFEATEKAGVRALVSAGWGGLGGVSVPSHVFMLGNVPHDWLFGEDRVQAVVHHGGAGTTAIGLAKGRPTVVVPFFGDQAFWGDMIHKAGAGPAPINHKKLDGQNLADAIKFAVSAPAKLAAKRLADRIQSEDGVVQGVDSFYRHLPLLNMRCDLEPSRVAVWWSTEYCLKLSAFAAQTLADAKLLQISNLDLHRSKEYNSRRNISDPVTGGAVAIFWTVTHYYSGIAQIFYSPVKGIIKTTTAIPKGVMDIITSLAEGMQNAPKLYGSETREPGKRTDWKSGIKEGGKGLFYGYYDGITGLYKTPIAGAKKEGFAGFVKGAAKSWIDVTMKPAAGIVGVVAHPLEGAWKGFQTSFGKKQDQLHLQTRVDEGVDAVWNSTDHQRQSIIERFKQAKNSTKDRQQHYGELAQKEALAEQKDFQDSKDANQPHEPSKSPPPLPPRGSTEKLGNAPPTSGDDEDSEDAAFLRDMEFAKQLSLAEQRGYERGLASQSWSGHTGEATR